MSFTFWLEANVIIQTRSILNLTTFLEMHYMVIKRFKCKRAALIQKFKASKKMLKCNYHKCNVGCLKRNARKTKYTFEKLPVI